MRTIFLIIITTLLSYNAFSQTQAGSYPVDVEAVLYHNCLGNTIYFNFHFYGLNSAVRFDQIELKFSIQSNLNIQIENSNPNPYYDIIHMGNNDYSLNIYSYKAFTYHPDGDFFYLKNLLGPDDIIGIRPDMIVIIGTSISDDTLFDDTIGNYFLNILINDVLFDKYIGQNMDYYILHNTINANINCGNPFFRLTPISNSPIHIFPNPSKGIYTIQTNQTQMLQVINSLGQEVLQTIIDNGQRSVNLTNVPLGMYVFRFTTKEGLVTSHKVIKHE